MRCALFTASAGGVALATELATELSDTVDVYVKEGREAPAGVLRYEKLAPAVEDAFSRYDALIFFMAAGIAVRMIAPHIKSKLTDPAVIVVDEAARHAVSLLSGHVGGANHLTRRIADILGAEPVITTATDAEGLIAPDSVALELGLCPTPKSAILTMNGALLDGKPLFYAVDAALSRRDFFMRRLTSLGLSPVTLTAEEAMSRDGLTVFVTERDRGARENLLYLVPRRLVAGIGCRRGTSHETISAALSAALVKIGQTPEAVSLIASCTAKSDEAGILSLARELGVPARFFENETLQRTIDKYRLRESEFVKRTIGIGNVAEAAALASVKSGRIAMGKTKMGPLTVALVWEK